MFSQDMVLCQVSPSLPRVGEVGDGEHGEVGDGIRTLSSIKWVTALNLSSSIGSSRCGQSAQVVEHFVEIVLVVHIEVFVQVAE